jgi:hypothetical protein
VWLIVFPPKDNKVFLAKMELLYDTELRDIYEDLDKVGIHLPPPHQQLCPQTKNSTQCCQRMPRINLVVDSIERLNTIKEEADEDVEPPTEHSLALEDKVITFVEALTALLLRMHICVHLYNKLRARLVTFPILIC